MLTKKTVFVLGAGASAPFGFLTGFGLSKKLIDDLTPSGHLHTLLESLGYGAQILKKFRDAFFESGNDSIDAFLEHRPEFNDLGKHAIAAALIPYEQTDSVFAFNENNLLRYMFNRINTTFEEFGKNTLSFVTFNYDRVVEFFLLSALVNSHNRSIGDCVNALQTIPIVHLHGKLGDLPSERLDGGSRPFTNDCDSAHIRLGAKNIRIIHDEIKEEDLQRARQLLSKAEQVYFLGFGFHSINVERLGIKSFDPNKGLALATAFNLTTHEIGFLKEATDGKVFFYNNFDCIGLCRNVVNWR
jgi:hypothetical protein